MENKKYINGLQSCSHGLMSVVDIVSSEEILLQSGFTPCNIFDFIRYILVGNSNVPPVIQVNEEQFKGAGINLANENGGILGYICEELREAISDVENNKLRKQLLRTLELCECLSKTLEAINCNDCAFHLVGKLFCLLLEIILAIVAIIVKILVLLSICYEKCTSDKLRSSFCNCLICELERELDYIQYLIEELSDLAIAFVRFASKDCKSNHCKCEDHWENKWDCKCKDNWENKCDWDK